MYPTLNKNIVKILKIIEYNLRFFFTAIVFIYSYFSHTHRMAYYIY